MTIDEAIEHCDEQSLRQQKLECTESAAEHKQRSEWLKELREFQKLKSIDEETLERPMYPSEWELLLSNISSDKFKQSGTWVGLDEFPHEDWECSACGGVILDKSEQEIARYKYCPYCGARMGEGNEAHN